MPLSLSISPSASVSYFVCLCLPLWLRLHSGPSFGFPGAFPWLGYVVFVGARLLNALCTFHTHFSSCLLSLSLTLPLATCASVCLWVCVGVCVMAVAFVAAANVAPALNTFSEKVNLFCSKLWGLFLPRSFSLCTSTLHVCPHVLLCTHCTRCFALYFCIQFLYKFVHIFTCIFSVIIHEPIQSECENVLVFLVCAFRSFHRSIHPSIHPMPSNRPSHPSYPFIVLRSGLSLTQLI